MINDLKLGYRSLRYTYNLKGNITSAALMFGLGILISLFSSINTYMGSFFIMIAGMMPVQMIYSLNITGLVLSSPVRKRMQTRIPTVCSLVSILGIYLFLAVMKVLCAWVNPEMQSYYCKDLVAAAVFGAAMMLYMGIAFKYFWISTILFFTGFILISDVIERVLYSNGGIWSQGVVSFAIAILLGIAILAAAAFLSYLLSLALYKKTVSKRSQNANLQKYM